MNQKKRNDLTLKIFALLIAVILWSYVMNKENPTFNSEFKNVHVDFINESALESQGLIVMEPRNASIKVSVSGRRSEVSKITDKDIKAQVDLSGYLEGNVKVPVDVLVPEDVRLLDYSPKEILFRFDKIVRKESPVTVDVQGQLPTDYILGTPEIKPQSVYIEGARTWINSVSKVVAYVAISEQTEDINITVPIKVIDDDGEDVRGISKDQNVVDIYIPIYQVKRVPIELHTENQLPDNLEIVNVNISPSIIEIKGKKGDLAGIFSVSTKPIDINALIDNVDVPIELELPDGVSLVEPDKKITLNLIIDESITKTFSYTLADVDIANMNRTLHIDEEDLSKTFTLIVKGISSIIDTLEKEDISLELDLKNLGEGIHKVSLGIKEQDGVQVIDMTPDSFNVTLIKE